MNNMNVHIINYILFYIEKYVLLLQDFFFLFFFLFISDMFGKKEIFSYFLEK